MWLMYKNVYLVFLFLLSLAMIDSVGGPRKVNNFLTTLNFKSISEKNLKVMEKRAGEVIESKSKSTEQQHAQDFYETEMR